MTDPTRNPQYGREWPDSGGRRAEESWRQQEATSSRPVSMPNTHSSNGETGERSLSELFSELSRETKTLISQEMQLARAELKERTADVGKNVAQVALGGAVLYAGFLGLMFAAIYALSEVVELWLAAALVGLVVAAVGGILLYSGYNALKELDLAPRRTVDSIQENAQWLKREIS